MPSPTLMTVPISETVMLESKFSICERIISLISLAFIASIILSVVSCQLSVVSCCFLGNEQRTTDDGLASNHLFFQIFQLRFDRAVVDGRADFGDDAADNALVDVKIQADVFAR